MANTEDEGIQISVDMQWVASLEKKVSDTKFSDRGTKPTIFRVPDILKKIDPQAYEPLLVSLGPYHHDKLHLQAMNQLKWKCLKFVLEKNNRMGLKDYVDLIKKLETQARDAYSEEVKMDSNSFVEMMLLDGCFLMLTIMKWTDMVISEEITWMESVSSLAPHVLRDIYMLENQLPFFLLETLYESLFPTNLPSFRELTFGFIRMHVSTILKLSTDKIEPYHHIIHLLLSCIDPTTNHGIDNGNQSSTFGFLCNSKLVKTVYVDDSPWIPSATACKEAGIHFVRKRKGKSFLDITFQNGKLEIPQLRIDDNTDSLLRNLIAYEQCSTGSRFNVTSYMVFMDSLINTAADVELLQQHEIIFNDLEDTQQIATLFNKLGANVIYNSNDFYLKDVFNAMTKHRNTRCNKWRARCNHDYFSNPWAIISLFGALALFVLTATQAAFAILRYFLPPN
ncbi:UPF0481 protein At3g47200-like [Curcuma longa]|uniref:UPF0481 protein At3g47200-like n=1 Tax=Curcuma longa TaxID=136217 RepID=UPI003D9E7C89